MEPKIAIMAIAALLLLSDKSTLGAFMKNRYNIDVETIQVCPDNDQMESPYRNLKFTRINRTHKALSFDITYKRPLDENVGGAMLVDRWGDGGWIKVPFLNFQKDICHTMLNHFPAIWINFNTAMHVQRPDKCPIPPGNYSMRNFLIDLSSIQVPFWSGRFRATAIGQTADTRKHIYCVTYIINIKEQF